MIQSQKAQETLASNNFLVSILSVAFMIVGIGSDSYDAATAIAGTAALVNITNPILKIIRSGGFSWSKVKQSKNFWTQVSAFVLLALSVFDINLPEGYGAAVVDAIFEGDTNKLIVLFGTLANIIYHIFKK